MIVPLQDTTPFSPFAPGGWREALAQVKAAGFDGVELAITNPGLLDSSAIAEALTAAGLQLLSITTGQAASLDGLSLSSEDDTVRRRAIDRIREHMRFAEPWDAVVIIGSLRGADGNASLLVEALRICARSNPSIRLALEPLNRYETHLVHTVKDALQLLDKVGAENLGVLFDTFHANIEESSIGEAIQQAGDRLFHVHLADSNRWVPGYGHTDFSLVWHALDGVHYARGVVLESLPLPTDQAVLAAPGALHSAWKHAQTAREDLHA
jgi:sugar phosphate isomerase/epimerase